MCFLELFYGGTGGYIVASDPNAAIYLQGTARTVLFKQASKREQSKWNSRNSGQQPASIPESRSIAFWEIDIRTLQPIEFSSCGVI